MMIVHILVIMFILKAHHGKSQLPVQMDTLHVPAKILRERADGTCPSYQEVFNAYNISALLAEFTRCGGASWRRVGYLDMTDPSQFCPPGLELKMYSPGLRSCGRVSTTIGAGCWSTFYNTGGFQYSRVCGRIRGNQFAIGTAFHPRSGLDSIYVGGVSLTHGPSSGRTHIWTFAAGVSEAEESLNIAACPCDVFSSSIVPSFVGNDYFCESGLNAHRFLGHPSEIFYPNDPLWDGQNCNANSTCCQLNKPPYFTKTLPAPTTDNIELRICSARFANQGDTPIDQVELYVQ